MNEEVKEQEKEINEQDKEIRTQEQKIDELKKEKRLLKMIPCTSQRKSKKRYSASNGSYKTNQKEQKKKRRKWKKQVTEKEHKLQETKDLLHGIRMKTYTDIDFIEKTKELEKQLEEKETELQQYKEKVGRSVVREEIMTRVRRRNKHQIFRHNSKEGRKRSRKSKRKISLQGNRCRETEERQKGNPQHFRRNNRRNITPLQEETTEHQEDWMKAAKKRGMEHLRRAQNCHGRKIQKPKGNLHRIFAKRSAS